MHISMIAAVAENRAIGKDNKMLWHIPEDFKYFKKVTMGKPVIMGRKTFESIGQRLPGRLNIVVTRNPDWSEDGVTTVHDIKEAVQLAIAECAASTTDEIFIIGGDQIYQQMIDQVDRLYITEIKRSYPEADTFFPEIKQEKWQRVQKKSHYGDGANKPGYSFCVYERTGS